MVKNLAWHGEDQDVYLNVAAYNERAKSFYVRHGFVLTGETAHSETAVVGGAVIPELEMLCSGKRNENLPRTTTPT